jgi:penicillin-binding protein 2
MKVAGKTGTSQVVKLGEDRKKAVAYQYKDHGLFVAFAPYERPEIAVAVVVEHGGGGGAVAAPIAGKILRNYFDLQKPPPAPKPKSVEEPQDDAQVEAPVRKQENQEKQGADD